MVPKNAVCLNIHASAARSAQPPRSGRSTWGSWPAETTGLVASCLGLSASCVSQVPRVRSKSHRAMKLDGKAGSRAIATASKEEGQAGRRVPHQRCCWAKRCTSRLSSCCVWQLGLPPQHLAREGSPRDAKVRARKFGVVSFTAPILVQKGNGQSKKVRSAWNLPARPTLPLTSQVRASGGASVWPRCSRKLQE